MKFRVLIEQGDDGVLAAVVPAPVTRCERTVTLKENPSTFIPIGMTHRLEIPGAAPLILVEVQSHGFLGEDDIERFDDCSNRA
jgi:mannose-1-phosphate guanylyltransferase/mannose-6-phosphate isomerase